MLNIHKIAQSVSTGIFKESLLADLMENIREDYPDTKAIIKKFWQTEPKDDVGGVHLHMEFEFEIPKELGIDEDQGLEETKYDIQDKLRDYFEDFVYYDPDGNFVNVDFDVKEKMDSWKISATYEEGIDR